jgi:two-component system, chemotaxis family, protein-glutamate methylesterase/glutaminase
MAIAQTKLGSNPIKKTQPIRVMLVDDSIVARSILERILSQHDEIEIVSQAEDTETALNILKQKNVDIILLDIEMPGRNGLDALPEFIDQANGARILIVSSFAEKNGPAAIQALSLGACDTLAKPGRTNFTGQFSSQLIDKVVRLGKSKKTYNLQKRVNKFLAPQITNKIPKCIAIGASTGGIPAIYEFVRNLDDSIICPIFITQHLPDAFMAFFAKQLSSQTLRKVVVAEHGMPVENNTIYIASGNSHLCCVLSNKKVLIELVEYYSKSRYCPSVDAMFEAIAEVYGDSSIGIVLSGMGNDGLIGARSLSAANANVIVQDDETSVIWGMPGAIARQNLASAIMAPSEMAKLLNGLEEAHIV